MRYTNLYFAIIFLLSFSGNLFAQVAWQDSTDFNLEWLIQTSDSGFIASGWDFRGHNFGKLDKLGKQLWNQQILFNNTALFDVDIEAELPDGYIGIARDAQYNPVLVKIDKDGNSLYELSTPYSNVSGVLRNTVLLTYKDSLIGFNHIKKSYSWKTQVGMVYDLKIMKDYYLLLTLDMDSTLNEVSVDTNGALFRKVPLIQKFKPGSALFYKSGLVSYDKNVLAYLNIAGIPVWSKSLPNKVAVSRVLSVSKDYVYFANSPDYSSPSTFYKFDSTGKVVWQTTGRNTYGANIFETFDGGLVAVCTTYTNGGQNLIVKYNPQNLVTGIDETSAAQALQVMYNADQNSYMLVFGTQSTGTEQVQVRLVNAVGQLVGDFSAGTNNLVIAEQPAGMYYYSVNGRYGTWKGKLVFR